MFHIALETYFALLEMLAFTNPSWNERFPDIPVDSVILDELDSLFV